MTAKASNGKQRAHSTHNDNCFSSFSFRGRWCSFCFCFCFSFHRHLSTHYRSRANFMSNLIWLREKCQQMFLYKYPSIYPYKKNGEAEKEDIFMNRKMRNNRNTNGKTATTHNLIFAKPLPNHHALICIKRERLDKNVKIEKKYTKKTNERTNEWIDEWMKETSNKKLMVSK